MTEKPSLFSLIATLTIVIGGTLTPVESPSIASQAQIDEVVTTNFQLVTQLSPNIASPDFTYRSPKS